MYLDPKKYNVFEPEDSLLLNNQPTEYTMLNFWQLSLSDILFNMTRGTFAEYIVRCALYHGGYDTFHQMNGTIQAWDITGPKIPMLGWDARIEVKSAASIQADTPDEKEPLSLPDPNLRFGISKAINWQGQDEIPRRNNDLYVFCHYKATRKTDNMLDLKLWDFYVYPTYKINEDERLKNKNGISLYKLKSLEVKALGFSELYVGIMETIADISNHFSK